MESIDRERAQRIKEGRTESTRSTDSAKENVKYALTSVNEDGVEVYVTSEETKKFPLKERKKRFLNLMREEYKGRTAKFIVNGKAYYATFDKKDLQKNIYGDQLSSLKGWEAKINTGADGAVFELVENSRYIGNSKESGKDIKAHKGITDWDYFVKKVEIDGVLYDLVANVRKNSDNQYVYSIQLNENKRRQTAQQKVNKTFVNQARSASVDDSVSQKSETVNTHSMQNGEKYAVSDDSGAEKITVKDVRAVQSVGRKSVNDFTSEDIKKTEGFARRYFKEMGAKSPFFRAWFGDWRANDTSKITVADRKGAARGKIKNRDTGWDIQVSGKVFNETKARNQDYNTRALPYLDYINSIVENAVLLDSYAIPENKAKSPNSVMMHSLYAIADMGKGKELVKLYIEELNDVNSDGTMKRAYQLQNIENQQLNDRVQDKSLAPSASTADVDTISQLFDLVKQKEKNFNPKTSSKIVNEDGTPKVVYHGTSEKFTVFDRTKGRSNMDIQGMFFSPWEIDARGYGGNVGEYYLSIKNPAPEGIAYKALKMFAGQNYAGIKAREYLEKLGYDGVNNSDEEIIAFYPNQIKSATDNIGTFDKGNNDIRYAVSDEETGGKRSRTRGAA